MKRSALFLYAMVGLLCAVATAQAADVQNPMIVYRNDGQFNAFSTNDVDSITFSNISVDSVACSSVVTQIFWSGGVPFAVPVEATDSVAFTAPANRLQSGVTELSGELLAHLLRCEDDYNLIFDTSLPKNLIPRTGDRLVTLDMTEKLPIGFIGEVNAVESTTDHIRVTCDEIGLADVYETFFGSFNGNISNNGKDETSIDSEEDESQSTILTAGRRKVISSTYDRTLNFPTFKRIFRFKSSYDIAEDLDVGSEGSIAVSVSPKLRLRTFVLVESPLKMSTSTTIIADFAVEETFSEAISGKYTKHIELIGKEVPIAVAPAIKFFVEAGLLLEIAGEFGLDTTFSQEFRAVGHSSWSLLGGDNGNIEPSFDFKMVRAGVDDVAGVGDGSLTLGVYGKFGIAPLCKDLLNVNFELDAGWIGRLNARVSEDEFNNMHNDTRFYESMSKIDAISLSYFRNLSFNTEVLKGVVGTAHELARQEFTLMEKPLLPKFHGVTAVRNSMDKYRVDAQSNYFEGAVNAIPGFVALKVNKDNSIDTDWTESTDGKIDGHKVTAILNSGDISSRSRVYPTLKAFNRDILASPGIEVDSLDTSVFEAEIIDNFILVDSKFQGKNKYLVRNHDYTKDSYDEQFRIQEKQLVLSVHINGVDTVGMNLGRDVELGYFVQPFVVESKAELEQFVNEDFGKYYANTRYLPEEEDISYCRYFPLEMPIGCSGNVTIVCGDYIKIDDGVCIMGGICGIYAYKNERVKLNNIPFYIIRDDIPYDIDLTISNPSYTVSSGGEYTVSYDIQSCFNAIEVPNVDVLDYSEPSIYFPHTRYSHYAKWINPFSTFIASSSLERKYQYDYNGLIAYRFNPTINYITESYSVRDKCIIYGDGRIQNSLLYHAGKFLYLGKEPYTGFDQGWGCIDL